jgi:hypothetical protein
MAEEVHEVHHRGGRWIAWLALILSIIALLLAWTAYNRTGADLENRIQEGVNNVIDEAQGQR